MIPWPFDSSEGIQIFVEWALIDFNDEQQEQQNLHHYENYN